VFGERNIGTEKECFIEGEAGVFGKESLLSASLVNNSGFVMMLDRERLLPLKRENNEKKLFCCFGPLWRSGASKRITRGANGGVTMKEEVRVPVGE
jgi:hypothetical protein